MSLDPTADNSSNSEAEAERRQATVLFADLAGYTALSEEIEEERAFGLARQVIGLMVDAVEDAGGVISDIAGDGMMALFGAIHASERAPLDACGAAIAIHAAMTDLGQRLGDELPLPPKVRVGINSGLVIVGSLSGGRDDNLTALGDTVNLASRFEELAEPGTTLIGASTYAMVRGAVAAEFLGRRDIRGKAEPQGVYRLDGLQSVSRFEGERAARGLSAFVGRDAELDDLLALSRRTGDGFRVAQLVGEAGIGKSRLLHEFRRAAANDNVTILSGDCVPGGERTPMQPLMTLLRDAFGISPDDPREEAKEKIARGLARLDLDTPRHRALLANVLGQELLRGGAADDPVLLRQETVALLLSLIERQCAARPLVLILEDLHWIDPVSEDFFERLREMAEPLPLMLLCTFRPEYEPAWAPAALSRVFALDSLARSTLERFLANRAGAATPSPRLIEFVEDRSDGNPLFAEHIIDYCRDHGYLSERDGVLELTELVPRDELPDSLQSLILARLDSLDPRVKSVLQAAAVIGRRFRRVALESLLDSHDDLDLLLDQALGVSMIETDEESDEYIFCHALLSDVLYQSLLTPARRVLHGRAAMDLRTRYANRLHEVADRLALHYEAADDAVNAARFLVLAAEHDMAIHALEEARDKFVKAAAMLPEEEWEAEADPVSRLASGLVRTYDRMAYYRQVRECAEIYLPFLERAGNPDDLLIVRAQYGMALIHGERYADGEAVAKQCIKMAEARGNDYYLAYGKLGLMMLYTRYSDHQPAEVVERLGEECLPIALDLGDVALESNILFELSINFMHRGLINEAHDYAARLAEMGRRHGDPRVRSFALWTRGFLDLVLEQFDDALAAGLEAERVAVTRQDQEGARGTLGCVYAARGEVEPALRYLEAALTRADEDADTFYAAGLELYYAVALIRAGRLGEGVRVLERRMRRADETGYRTNYHYGQLILAEVYLALILREEKAPASVLLKNLGFLLRTLPGIAGKTEALFEAAMTNPQWAPDSIGHCRAHAGLGQLYARTKRPDQAREQLDKAARLATHHNARAIRTRIDSALAALG